MLLEKILHEFVEPLYGYIRVAITVKPLVLESGTLSNTDKLKFYFWINVSGLCTMSNPKTGRVSKVF